MASANISTSTYASSAPGSTFGSESGAVLQLNLSRLSSRRNMLVLWHAVATALSWGLGVAALLILAHRFYLVELPWWIPALAILISLAIGARTGLLARRGAFATALEADEKLGLKEILSSAYSFVQPSTSTPITSTELVPSLVDDAAVHSQSLEPKKIYPLAFDRTHRVLALCAAIFAMTLFMPNVPWLLAAEEQSARKAIALQGEELVKVAKEIRKEDEKKAESTAARQAKKLEALGQKMQRGRMGKKEALTSLGELKKDLEKASKNDGQNQNAGANQEQMQAALEQLADQPMDSEAGQRMQDELKKGNAEAAAKEVEKLADKIDKGELSPEEQKKAADDMNKMAKGLKQQGGQQNEKMAQQLEQAAKSLQQQAKQQQQGQKKGQQNGKNQQQGQQGGKTQQQQKGGNQGASSAMRDMAKSMRQGNSSNSQNLQKMLNKIREAEQGTGSNGGKQFGGQMKPGQGQGDCPGGDCNGQGMTPGKDLKSSDPHGTVSGGAGLGPRNNAEGSNSGGGVSDIKSKRTGDKRRWADVWSDRVPPTRKKVDRIQGKYGDEGETEQLPTRTEAKGGPVKTPYYEVYESYNKDAEDAINKETVPPAYKQPVKEYFESIKPD